MKKRLISIILISCVLLALAACGADKGYTQITAEEAKAIMDSSDDVVILDVRTEEEFAEGHIPGAILIPDYEIEEQAETQLKDKEQVILVYCRSGNRSKAASAALAEMGYTNVQEFGGINDWPYETDKEKTYRPCDKPGDEKYKQE